MAKNCTSFQPTVNIWAADRDLFKLQRGQWVSAGVDGPRGRYYGTKPSGTIVVAWQGNAKASRNYREYQRNLLNYAKA